MISDTDSPVRFMCALSRSSICAGTLIFKRLNMCTVYILFDEKIALGNYQSAYFYTPNSARIWEINGSIAALMLSSDDLTAASTPSSTVTSSASI